MGAEACPSLSEGVQMQHGFLSEWMMMMTLVMDPEDDHHHLAVTAGDAAVAAAAAGDVVGDVGADLLRSPCSVLM